MNYPVLEVVKLSKSYKTKNSKVDALCNFDIKINAGEIFGLLGPNGAGKTTAVKLIMGFLHPTDGEIFFSGKKAKTAEPRTSAGYLPESFKPNPNLSVYEYLKFQFDLSQKDHRKSLKGEIEELLEQVGMKKFSGRKISTLSKGMGQRLGLAQAFANDPEFLILDEPTSGLDPIGQGEVIDFLQKAKQLGKTIFFCSHHLTEVEKMCDRIGVIVEGQLKFSGNIDTFKSKWNSLNLEEAFRAEVLCKKSSQ